MSEYYSCMEKLTPENQALWELILDVLPKFREEQANEYDEGLDEEA